MSEENEAIKMARERTEAAAKRSQAAIDEMIRLARLDAERRKAADDSRDEADTARVTADHERIAADKKRTKADKAREAADKKRLEGDHSA